MTSEEAEGNSRQYKVIDLTTLFLITRVATIVLGITLSPLFNAFSVIASKLIGGTSVRF